REELVLRPVRMLGCLARALRGVEQRLALLLRAPARDVVGGLPREQIEQSAVPVARTVRPAEMRRHHPEDGAAAADERRRLDRAKAGMEQARQRRRAREDRTRRPALDDAALAPGERHAAARDLVAVDDGEERREGRVEPHLRRELQCAARLVVQLQRALVRARDPHRRLENGVEALPEVVASAYAALSDALDPSEPVLVAPYTP